MLTEIIKVNPKNPERKIIKLAADIMRRGGIVAFPTETVYGLGADPFNARAVRKLFRAKNRRADKPVSILVCNDSDVKRIAVTIPKSARVLIDEFFPGALTVILKKKKEFSDILTGGKNTIGIRMPDSKIARALIKEFGGPIAATSANISGSNKEATSALSVVKELNGKVPLVLDGGKSKVGVPSTVIDFTGQPPKIIRAGGISRSRIEKIIGRVEV